MNITIRTFGTLGSTNTEALEQARAGAAEGSCIVARRQTAGRGRFGRTWVSSKDTGLYLSIILRPKLEPQSLPLITLMAGVAVHDTVQSYGLSPDIKWVNDILVDERKISGILSETAETEWGVAVVVGIGLNLLSRGFPPEIVSTATSIEDITGQAVTPDDAAGTLTRSLSYFYRVLNGSGGPDAILDEWRKRSTYFSAKPVRVSTGTETITGITDGLERNGALRVKRQTGEVVVVQAGDVERLRAEPPV